jgi:hypothetical protein
MALAAAPLVDPALEGRDLGPWFMVPWWISVPVGCAVGAVAVWYFIRLGRSDVPRERRWVRRISLVLVFAALVPLVRGLTFAHPHEDRAAFATAWAMVLLLVLSSLVLAIIDVMLTARRGLQDYRELRRETLGGKRKEGSGG